jgi:putative ABC transport system permease protein
VTIVGLATFGGEDGMAQVTFTGMTVSDAEKYLTARPGEAASIQVRAGPDVSGQELVDRLTPALPKGVEAITGQESAEENNEMISSQFLSIFTLFLLVFSGIALLVATFSIHNTFAIVVAQRTRENALLRALGASRRQVTVTTLVEATVVAVAASVAGLAGGIGIAAGLQALFPAIGFPFPEGDLVVTGLSMALPPAVGIVVCLGSALLPAVRAGRTAPLAALRARRPSTPPARPVRGRSPARAWWPWPSPSRWPASSCHRRSGWRAPAPSWRWSRSWCSARSPPPASSGSSAARSTGCAVSPAPSPGATPCAARSAPPPPPAP